MMQESWEEKIKKILRGFYNMEMILINMVWIILLLVED